MTNGYILENIKRLSDRDLMLLMRCLYQEGFQDCADSKCMDSEMAIVKLVEDFNRV